ncbi:MAG: nicotinate-nucleotide--dimethylbenzimidazole phosphoribosyltransferase [Burkholderiales bacterium]|nr:nicotinate-nucleotide--dimethylbenzimidazole phosphoribosyltransferase [Burkholderiales bacterium]
MAAARSLVNPTSNPALERALREKLVRRQEAGGALGELEPLAVRIGLMQNTLKPRLREPQLMIFAADHGVAVDGVDTSTVRNRGTSETVRKLLTNQLPLTVFARAQQMSVTVVDCGMADESPVHDRLLMRKIAHGTRNTRVAMAMTLEQAHAAMRAGMEIGDKLRGNATVLAGVGVGAHESASLVLARLTDSPLRDLVISGPDMDTGRLTHLMAVMMGAMARHRDITEPVEVLAAFGGFEVAVMVGVMLMAASKRHLLMIDGVPACAALMVASRIAPAVTDYCVFCRSHHHRGLDQALNLFSASALLEIGMEATDGTGATLAWPLVRSAAALLTEVAEGEEAGPSAPGAFDAEPEPFTPEPHEEIEMSSIFGPKLY